MPPVDTGLSTVRWPARIQGRHDPICVAFGGPLDSFRVCSESTAPIVRNRTFVSSHSHESEVVVTIVPSARSFGG